MKKPNRNQVHLPNQQETKLSKPTMSSSHLKQKEPMAIKKSLLTKPIIMSKSVATAGKTDTTSLGPCKPAGLKRPAQKLNATKGHQLQITTVPEHSTPIKDQTGRRRSVAVSPQRDSSIANDDRLVIQAKQRRRSGIPLPGGMVRIISSLAGICLSSSSCFFLNASCTCGCVIYPDLARLLSNAIAGTRHLVQGNIYTILHMVPTLKSCVRVIN